MPMEELVGEEEAGKDACMWEVPPTEELVLEQVPALPVTLLVVAGIWGGPGDQVAGQGPATSSRAQGKAPTIQLEYLPLV